jgi:hypothetical protein
LEGDEATREERILEGRKRMFRGLLEVLLALEVVAIVAQSPGFPVKLDEERAWRISNDFLSISCSILQLSFKVSRASVAQRFDLIVIDTSCQLSSPKISQSENCKLSYRTAKFTKPTEKGIQLKPLLGRKS